MPVSHASASGPAAMSSARSKLASFFSGDIEDPLDEFLHEELTDNKKIYQKVETVIRYVDPSQRDLRKSLEGFINRDWDDLCRDLRDEYVDPTPQGRYSEQKLLDLTTGNKTTLVQMEDEWDVIKYYRNFNVLSKPLLDHFPRAAFLTLSIRYPSRSIGQAPRWPPTLTKHQTAPPAPSAPQPWSAQAQAPVPTSAPPPVTSSASLSMEPMPILSHLSPMLIAPNWMGEMRTPTRVDKVR